MNRFFTDSIEGNTAVITGEDVLHIRKVLRLGPGDRIMVCDGKGTEYTADIAGVGADRVECLLSDARPCVTESEHRVTLLQAVPKSGKMETIIQKCVELGAVRIVPVLTKRCVSRPDEKSSKKKNERYNKIALEAAQQSGRGIVPEVGELIPLEQAAKDDSSDIKIVFYEGGGEPLKTLVDKDAKSVSIYIGPEGGFEKDEVELLVSGGAKPATLGKRILRTQTAPVAALSAIMLITNNLE